MKITKKAFQYVCLASLLVGCTSYVSPTATTVTPSISISPSSTSVPTITNSDIPTITPEVISESCLEKEAEIPQSDIDGIIALNGAYEFYDRSVNHYVLNPGTAYLWDVKNDVQVELLHQKGEELKAFYGSPDHQFLLYSASFSNGGGTRVTVVDANGNTIRNIVNGYNWFLPVGWLGDDQIAVWALSDVRNGIPFPTLVYNPFTKDTKFLMPDYPNIYNWHLSNWSDTLTVYDPSLSLVLYPVIGNTNLKDGIVLWSLNNQKQIAFFPLASPEIEISQPLWSHNGQQFVMGARLENDPVIELYLADTKGEIQQLSHFDELIKRRQITSVELLDYSWSHNGRLIAFWYSFDKQGPFRLATVDTLTGKITDLCVTSPANETIIWSPDGTQLLVGTLIDQGEIPDDYRVLLIDVLDNYGFEIAKGVLPVGWLASLP